MRRLITKLLRQEQVTVVKKGIKESRNVLHNVVEKRHYTAIAEMLIQQGADVHAEDRCGNIPYDYAYRRGNGGMTALLIQHMHRDK